MSKWTKTQAKAGFDWLKQWQDVAGALHRGFEWDQVVWVHAHLLKMDKAYQAKDGESFIRLFKELYSAFEAWDGKNAPVVGKAVVEQPEQAGLNL